MKRKITMSIAVFLPALLCMGMIFYFSSQSTGQSNNLSREFTSKIAEILFRNFDSIDEKIQGTIIYELNFFIRKTAHFSVFFLMSCFIYTEAVIWTKKYLLSGVISIAICTVYALADEFHQIFTPGRTPLLRDVFIDTTGAVLGAVFSFCAISVIYHIKSITQKNSSSRLSSSLSDA